MKIFPKINIIKIVADHLGTLKSQLTNKPSLNDWLTFFIVPLVVSILLLIEGHFIKNNDVFNTLITILSILGGFSFNLLGIIFGYRDKIESYVKDNPVKKLYLKEIHTNISFSIVNSMVCIVLLLLTRLNCSSLVINISAPFKLVSVDVYMYVINFFSFFSLTFYFLTLFMVIKRLNILFNHEFKNTTIQE